jgi:hypothetical protein
MINNGISIIDFVGKFEDGIAVNLSMVYENKSYFLMYWFNKEGQVRLVPEQKLLEKLNVIDIYQYEYINELVYFIHNNIENIDEIFNEFI